MKNNVTALATSQSTVNGPRIGRLQERLRLGAERIVLFAEEDCGALRLLVPVEAQHRRTHGQPLLSHKRMSSMPFQFIMIMHYRMYSACSTNVY